MSGAVPITQRLRFTGIRLLPDNEAAWAAKRHLIATARRTLDLSYFILEVDGSTSRLMLDLIDAAQRGIQVRLMVDYFTTFLQAPALRLLGQVPNLQVRRYGAPSAVWLGALQEAAIEPAKFVTSLMAADQGGLLEALKGSSLFGQHLAGQLAQLRSEPGDSAVDFPKHVLEALQNVPVAHGGAERDAAVRRAAVLMHVLRGLKKFLHRNHHKLLLADGRRFVMGGRNLADAYHRHQPAAGHPFQDTDVMARDGHAGGSPHAATFQRLWDSAMAVDVRHADPLDARSPTTQAVLEQAALPVPPRRPGAQFRGGVKLPDMDGHFVDNLPAEHGDPSITLAYAAQVRSLIEAGRPAVLDIVSAYLCPAEFALESPHLLTLRDTLVSAAKAGLSVNVYTNSLASTDLRPVNSAAYPRLAAMIEAGVRIFELAEGQGSLHTKSAALGNHRLLIGSYNMDPRSELYDTNNLVVLEDPAAEATTAFRAHCIQRLNWMELTAQSLGEMVATGARRHAVEAVKTTLL